MHCVAHGDINAELRHKLCILVRRIMLSACIRGPAMLDSSAVEILFVNADSC